MTPIHPTPRRRSLRRSGLGLVVVVTATIALAGSAAAHVDAELGDVSQTGLAEVRFSFHHGCDGAATTALRIQIPEGASDVTPLPAEGFTPNVSADEFGWSGGSIPDGVAAEFVATVQLSGRAGEVVEFPTIQQCGDLEEAWIGPATDDESEASSPAPTIVLPATYAGTGGEATTTSAEVEPPTTSTTPTGLVTSTTLSDRAMPEESETNTAGLVVFAVIVVVLVGGAVYLYLTNRRPRSGPGTGTGSPE